MALPPSRLDCELQTVRRCSLDQQVKLRHVGSSKLEGDAEFIERLRACYHVVDNDDSGALSMPEIHAHFRQAATDTGLSDFLSVTGVNMLLLQIVVGATATFTFEEFKALVLETQWILQNRLTGPTTSKSTMPPIFEQPA